MFSGILFYCIAPSQRHEKCVDLALQHGADVNDTSTDGDPVLVIACETAAENEHMCLALLKKGADPNAKTVCGTFVSTTMQLTQPSAERFLAINLQLANQPVRVSLCVCFNVEELLHAECH